jgi:hypothetical protein
MSRNGLFSIILLVISTTVALGVGETIVRIKNNSMTNYDMEMWRYAKELKFPSANPLLGHEHVKNSSALLQSVTIRTNEWGLRGGPVLPRNPDVRRILVLGGSITLGWGVPENETLTEDLAHMFMTTGTVVEVLNGGVGNYNAERYVERFFIDLEGLQPSDIIVHYFLRDAEKLDPGGGNILLRNSELAVTLWIAANQFLAKSGEKTLLDHYSSVYREKEPGYQAMLASLKKLSDYANQKGIRLYMAMTPDVHNLRNYQFGFIHERMHKVAAEYGYTFIDLLPAFGQLSPDKIWAMPGDPHPNALGHKLMAEAIFAIVSKAP